MELKSSARSTASLLRYLGERSIGSKNVYRLRINMADSSMSVTEATGWTQAGNELRQTVTLAAGTQAELRPIHLRNANVTAVAQAVDVDVRAEVDGVPVYETSHTVTLQPAAPSVAIGAPAELVTMRKTAVSLPLTVTNDGTARATGIRLSVDLPADVTYQGQAAGDRWTCHPPHGAGGANGTVTCDLQSLAAGESAPVTLTVTAGNGAAGKDITSRIDYDGGRSAGPVVTTVRVTDRLAACAPAWVQNADYARGALASYLGSNYERTQAGPALLVPTNPSSWWRLVGPCA